MHNAIVPNELLVPPRRMGQLLAQTRLELGYSLDEAAEALGGSWNSLELLEIETGHRVPIDRDLAALTSLYEIETGTLIPDRSRLVIDLDEGMMAVGPNSVHMAKDTVARRDLLANYLSLVYTMRDITPGVAVPLRYGDLDTLSNVVERTKREVEDELRQMMVEGVHLLNKKRKRLKGRLLVPVVGVVVAVTTAGTLLLMSDRGGAAEKPSSAPGGGGPEAKLDIGTAVHQERLPDGTPGPVEERG